MWNVEPDVQNGLKETDRTAAALRDQVDSLRSLIGGIETDGLTAQALRRELQRIEGNLQRLRVSL